MKIDVDKIKPAVDKRVLLFLAGFMWLGVGTMLLALSYSWLDAFHRSGSFLFEGIGVAAALVIHHFGFLKIVDKNLGRIFFLNLEELYHGRPDDRNGCDAAAFSDTQTVFSDVVHRHRPGAGTFERSVPENPIDSIKEERVAADTCPFRSQEFYPQPEMN
jgi:hypothetical protein